ncbi:MMPL family transporter [Nocardia sp. NPDC051321]|uniref:MMPL family transporter n=1 Tax=Nocardia sp. NPDC051321 TaxID=3364323 RepID=UPI0037B5FEDF
MERHAWSTVAVWGLLIALAAAGAANQNAHLTSGGFEAPGSQSQRVDERIASDFPAAASATLAVVLRSAPAQVSVLGQAQAEAVSRIGDLSGVSIVPSAPAAGQQHPDIRVIPLIVTGGQDSSIDIAKEIAKRLGIKHHKPAQLADGQVQAYLTGQGALYAEVQSETTDAVTKGELFAFPLIALTLLLVFGSLLSMALPVGVAMAAVVVTGGITYLLAQVISMSIFVSNAVSMVGIGVAVDYTLFVLVRFRSEVRGGATIEQARRTAMLTSGRAAVLSGCTVALALASLFIIDSTALRSIAIGTITVVAVAMTATVTLVPAIVALLGARFAAIKPRRNLIRARRDPARAGDFWMRWSDTVMRRPVLFVLAASALLLALALPATRLEMSNSVLRQLPDTNQAREGTELAGSVLGPGTGSPVQVLVTAAGDADSLPADSPSVAQAQRIIQAIDNVDGGVSTTTGTSGKSVLIQAVLTSDPESSSARDTVTELRGALGDIAGVTALVGGTTATIMDFDNLVSQAMWLIVAFIVIAGFALLMVILRSPVLAAKAIAMNLLSLAAAYGVLVMVFEWGWLSWLGIQAAPTVDTITPPLILAITFGLSMDYEIFLLSRIREGWEATGDNARAVAEGLAASARSISSAALLMVLVFIAFVLTGFPSAQRLGLGCAVAVAVDATVVRLVLVPAAMRLFGRWNWWFPGQRAPARVEVEI